MIEVGTQVQFDKFGSVSQEFYDKAKNQFGGTIRVLEEGTIRTLEFMYGRTNLFIDRRGIITRISEG